MRDYGFPAFMVALVVCFFALIGGMAYAEYTARNTCVTEHGLYISGTCLFGVEGAGR